MTPAEKLLDQLADYADQLADSDRLADAGSLDVAETLAELYEARDWVDEWLAERPIKGKSYGRPTQPDSRNRFAQWLVWKQEQRNRRAIKSMRTYQLFNAREVTGHISTTVEIRSERVIRPLDWFRKHKLADRIPEVWRRAVELAGTADAVTSAHTRQAVNEWKREHAGKVHVVVKHNRAEAHRIKAMDSVRILLSDEDPAEVKRLAVWFADQMKAYREAHPDA